MDDFLPKPVSLDALSSMLSRWLPVGGTTEGRMEDSYERPEEDPSHGPNKTPALRAMRILIAEDDAIWANLLERLLESAGYEIVPARNGSRRLPS
jgi:PleD family two-component response regulator